MEETVPAMRKAHVVRLMLFMAFAAELCEAQHRLKWRPSRRTRRSLTHSSQGTCSADADCDSGFECTSSGGGSPCLAGRRPDSMNESWFDGLDSMNESWFDGLVHVGRRLFGAPLSSPACMCTIVPPPSPVTVESCQAHKNANAAATSGYYVHASTGDVIWCEMEASGGGWTLCANWVDDNVHPLEDNSWNYWLSESHTTSSNGNTYSAFPDSLSFSELDWADGVSPYTKHGTALAASKPYCSGFSHFAYACSINMSEPITHYATGAIPASNLATSSSTWPPHATIPGAGHWSYNNALSGYSGYETADVAFSTHGEYAWLAYGTGSAPFGLGATSSYPGCGSSDCRDDVCPVVGSSLTGSGSASSGGRMYRINDNCVGLTMPPPSGGVFMEIMPHGDIWGIEVGSTSWSRVANGNLGTHNGLQGMQGVGCNGQHAVGLTTDRYSILVR